MMLKLYIYVSQKRLYLLVCWVLYMISLCRFLWLIIYNFYTYMPLLEVGTRENFFIFYFFIYLNAKAQQPGIYD